MSANIVAIMKDRVEKMAAALTDEQIQHEYNVRSMHYAWMIRQAQEYMEADLGPFAAELRKRNAQPNSARGE